MRRAVYAGSFDLITNGHLWMIEGGAELFDELVVAIGKNPEKKRMFTPEESLEMLLAITAKFPNVTVDSFEYKYLVHYAQSINAGWILRGIRTAADYEYERGMRNINGDIAPEIITVFLQPPRDLVETSSSFVRGLIGPEGWEKLVKGFVPPLVHRRLLRRFSNGKP